MSRTMLAVFGLMSLSLGSTARGHFVWIAVQADQEGKPVAAVWFNESPQPGAARLVERIKPTAAWVRTAGGKVSPLALKPQTGGETGGLAARLSVERPYSVEGTCRYGVFAHGDDPMLLDYYAKHIEADTPEALESLARAEKLPLDIVPRVTPEGLALTVLWQGKLAADAPITLLGPNDREQELTTDAQGQALAKDAAPGNYAIRARWVVEGAGELDGKAYKSSHHYTTLTLALPRSGEQTVTAAADAKGLPAKTSAASPTTDGAATGPTAQELLDRARDARAVWDDFPGFSADLALWTGGKKVDCRITVTADGQVQLRGCDGIDTAGVQTLLDSLVQHRMGGGGPQQSVVFAEEQGEHPLGRMIRFEGDTTMHSAYRVKDDVVTEVNRSMGGSRFTISVLDFDRNAEGKYLPTTIQVSFWDAKTGALKTSETHFTRWKRVGKFDLPERLTVIRAGKDQASATELDFSGHKLLGAEQASSRR